MIISVAIGATQMVTKDLKKKMEAVLAKHSYTWNITYNTESTAV
jgi:hypothetical protein